MFFSLMDYAEHFSYYSLVMVFFLGKVFVYCRQLCFVLRFCSQCLNFNLGVFLASYIMFWLFLNDQPGHSEVDVGSFFFL